VDGGAVVATETDGVMGTIDRYVLRQYLKVLLICFFSLTGLYVIIDALNNLDDLLAIGQQQGNLALGEYYGARAVAFFDRTSALMTLVAATFAVTAMQRSNELASLMAAGIPKVRVVAPLIAAAVVVSLLAAASRELVIPRFREKLTQDARDLLGGSRTRLTPRYDHRTDILLAGREAVVAERRIGGPAFRLPPGLGHFGSQLLAREAHYHRAQTGRPAGYLLAGVSQPSDLSVIESFYLADEPVILSPSDTPWLEADQCFVVSHISYEQLVASDAWRQFSSTAELIAGLHNPSLDFSADVRVAVHARLVQPFLDVTLLLLGLPMVLARESRNVFLAAGLCVLIVAVFFLVVLGCHVLGSSYLLRPALAAWCPLLIFAPLARLSAQAFWQ
jgi:lipopolysaccharide export system permease protein